MGRFKVTTSASSPYVTSSEAADLLGVSFASVRLYLDSGKLTRIDTPEGLRIPRSSIEAQLEARRNGTWRRPGRPKRLLPQGLRRELAQAAGVAELSPLLESLRPPLPLHIRRTLSKGPDELDWDVQTYPTVTSVARAVFAAVADRVPAAAAGDHIRASRLANAEVREALDGWVAEAEREQRAIMEPQWCKRPRSLLVQEIVKLVDEHGGVFSEEPTRLWNTLTSRVLGDIGKGAVKKSRSLPRDWPRGGIGLSQRLHQMAAELQAAGIEARRGWGLDPGDTSGHRRIRFRRVMSAEDEMAAVAWWHQTRHHRRRPFDWKEKWLAARAVVESGAE